MRDLTLMHLCHYSTPNSHPAIPHLTGATTHVGCPVARKPWTETTLNSFPLVTSLQADLEVQLPSDSEPVGRLDSAESLILEGHAPVLDRIEDHSERAASQRVSGNERRRAQLIVAREQTQMINDGNRVKLDEVTPPSTALL